MNICFLKRITVCQSDVGGQIIEAWPSFSYLRSVKTKIFDRQYNKVGAPARGVAAGRRGAASRTSAGTNYALDVVFLNMPRCRKPKVGLNSK